MKDRKIGDVFKFSKVPLRVVEWNYDESESRCGDCYFQGIALNICENQLCVSNERKDETDVIFKEVEP